MVMDPRQTASGYNSNNSSFQFNQQASHQPHAQSHPHPHLNQHPRPHPHPHPHQHHHHRARSHSQSRSQSYSHSHISSGRSATSSRRPSYPASSASPASDPQRPPQPPAPQIGGAHSRAQSTSSLPSTRDLNHQSRVMPPPVTSPPHQHSQQSLSHHHQQHSHNLPKHHIHQNPHSSHLQQPPQNSSHIMPGGYRDAPPPPRAPPVAVGPPSAFPAGRELPALGSITRTGSGSSMSISSMLGGPPPAPRDPRDAPNHQHYPPHSTGPPGPVSAYAPPRHASPRIHSGSTDYNPFRRPQTPDHQQRPYDPRTTAAQSPRAPQYPASEVPRYGTPQAFHSRHPSAADPSRDPSRMPTSVAPPPRPSSQPKSYPGMQQPMDTRKPGPGPGSGIEDRYGARDDLTRPLHGSEYNPEGTGLRPNPYDDPRYAPRNDRERQADLDRRQQERRERTLSVGDGTLHAVHHDYREPPRDQPPYSRPPDLRDSRDPHWERPGSDASFRAPMDHQRSQHPEYGHGPALYGPPGPPYHQPTPDHYGPASHGPHPQAHSAPRPHESPDRSRMHAPPSQQKDQPYMQQPPQPQPQQQRTRPGEVAQPPPPSGAYNSNHVPAPAPAAVSAPATVSYDPSRPRNSDEAMVIGHQRALLAIQAENRKGRISPLPQAVQGVQHQQPGPAAEPGIKSEFGRMFSGIGSGVSGLGMSSPVTAHVGLFTNAAVSKRDDVDTPDLSTDTTGKPKPRRRKLKDDAGVIDDDSSGRATPGVKAKRSKGHQHHHHHHHHHHHRPNEDGVQGAMPFVKNVKGNGAAASPSEKTFPPHHHHHHHHHHGPRQSQLPQAKQPTSPVSAIPPKTKTTVSSLAVLDSVAKLPRHHLGDFIYETTLKPSRLIPNTPSDRGFSSNPKPLPWEMIKGKLNCTMTVKIHRIHLSAVSREEITARGYIWGTDIYTDDSDVIAACIHGGWIQGKWTEELSVHAFDMDLDGPKRKTRTKEPAAAVDVESEGLITSPPATPATIPQGRDLHVDILILPKLQKYASTTRFGICSREFGGEYGDRSSSHDGLSYKIMGLRWVENGAQPQARLRGKARRERMRRAMKEVGHFNGGSVSGNGWWKKDATKVNGKDPEQQTINEGKENTVGKEKEADEADGDVQMRDANSQDTVEAAEEK